MRGDSKALKNNPRVREWCEKISSKLPALAPRQLPSAERKRSSGFAYPGLTSGAKLCRPSGTGPVVRWRFRFHRRVINNQR